MQLFATWLFSAVFLVETVLAGIERPTLSLSLDSPVGTPAVGVITPSLSWSSSKTVGDFDVAAGINVKTDVATNTYPCSGWAEIKRTFLGCASSAKLSVGSSDRSKLGVDLAFDYAPTGTGLSMSGTGDTEGKSFGVSSLTVTQSFDALGGSWTVAPSYNVPSEEGAVSVVYDAPMGTISFDAKKDAQKVALAKSFGVNTVSPSFDSDGNVDMKFSREIESGVVSATVCPTGKTAALSWSDGKWKADFSTPLSSNALNEAKLTLSCTGVTL